MIVDVHTHAWDCLAHMDPSFLQDLQNCHPGAQIDIRVEFDTYLKALEPCDRALCFGLRGLMSGLRVPNEFVAGFVARAPEKLIGFMSLDPNEPSWKEDFERSRQDLHLRGVKLGPIYAGFDPTDPKLDWLYVNCVKHNLPVLFHMGTSFVRLGPLAGSLEGLRAINRFTKGTDLPCVSPQAIEEIIHRDAIHLLWGEPV